MTHLTVICKEHERNYKFYRHLTAFENHFWSNIVKHSKGEQTCRIMYTPFDARCMIESICKEVKNNKKSKLKGVEIGVFDGSNAYYMLTVLDIEKLYLIDPYETYTEYNDEIYTQDLLDLKCKEASLKLKEYEDKIKFIKKKSEDATKDIDDQLDFVYIDGQHEYEYVKKDIELWYPKIKKGGYIGGHDFGLHCMGVCKAVIEFIEKNNIKNFKNEEIDWWIIKE